MKRLLILAVIMLCAGIAGAQSDCNADQCETIPLMGVYDDAEWNTDMFIHVEGTGTVFLRFRPAPQTPYTPMKTFQLQVQGSGSFGVYDLVEAIYGDIEFDGALVMDWATFDDPMEVDVLPLLRRNGALAGRTDAYLMEAGCHLLPAPWSGGSTSISIQVYNPSEGWAQTFTVDGGELHVILPSRIGHEQLITVEGEYSSAFVEICSGIDHAGSGGGVNLEQELWVLPRFFHNDDRVTTRVW